MLIRCQLLSRFTSSGLRYMYSFCSPDSTTCPLGYIGYKEKCFRFFPSNKFTESATDHCVSVGGYLATPRTQGEIDFFVTVVKSIPSLSNLSMWRLGIVDLMNGWVPLISFKSKNFLVNSHFFFFV